jgi:hypothetical protein
MANKEIDVMYKCGHTSKASVLYYASTKAIHYLREKASKLLCPACADREYALSRKN